LGAISPTTPLSGRAPRCRRAEARHAPDDRRQHSDVLEVVGADAERVVVEDDEVDELPGLEAADELVHAERARGGQGHHAQRLADAQRFGRP